MAVSPFAKFEQHLYAAPFNSVPGKARGLWDPLNAPRSTKRLDEPLLVKPAAKLDETPSIGGGMGGFCRHFRASALLFWTPLPPEVFLH